MSSNEIFPSLEGWHQTKEALHNYAKVAGAPARLLADPHPKWWHVSLEVTQDGLRSDVLSKADAGGKELRTLLNLRTHALELLIEGQPAKRFDLTGDISATALGNELQSALAGVGVKVELPAEKYADDNQRNYDPAVVERYLTALISINQAMQAFRADLTGDLSPVQLWPHHFDLAFEWFGTKTVIYEEEGEQKEYSAQLNFGFAPGDSTYPDPYFYSNPWPFDGKLTENSLPHGARWLKESFEGTLLPYQTIARDEGAADKLQAYFRKVYELAKPTLKE